MNNNINEFKNYFLNPDFKHIINLIFNFSLTNNISIEEIIQLIDIYSFIKNDLNNTQENVLNQVIISKTLIKQLPNSKKSKILWYCGKLDSPEIIFSFDSNKIFSLGESWTEPQSINLTKLVEDVYFEYPIEYLNDNNSIEISFDKNTELIHIINKIK